MIKAKGFTRKHSRQVFKDERKIFDMEVQRSKQSYVKEQQRETENLANNNQQEFWKKDRQRRHRAREVKADTNGSLDRRWF